MFDFFVAFLLYHHQRTGSFVSIFSSFISESICFSIAKLRNKPVCIPCLKLLRSLASVLPRLGINQLFRFDIETLSKLSFIFVSVMITYIQYGACAGHGGVYIAKDCAAPAAVCTTEACAASRCVYTTKACTARGRI